MHLTTPVHHRILYVLASVMLISGPALCEAQVPASEPADEGLIQLNLPSTVELKALIDYVSKRLGINIIYDESIGATRVAILSPAKIKKEELLDLLRSALKMSGLELVDGPQAAWKTIGRKALVRFVTVKNVSTADLAKRVSAVLEERDRITGGAGRMARRVAGPGAVAAAGADVTLVPDPKNNQIAVIATEADMAPTLALIASLDVSPDLQTRTYHVRHVSPQRIDSLMKGRIASETPEATYSSSLDETSGLLIVTARQSVQKLVETLVQDLDVVADPNRSNLQVYKLINTTATSVLETIRSLQSGSASAAAKAEERAPAGAPTFDMTNPFTGPNVPSSPGLEPTPTPPAYHAAATQPAEAAAQTSVTSALGRDAIVSADTNTNSIIVVAAPDVQREYKKLISLLDKRRPQVLVEVTLVTLDTTNNFSLGVELAKIKFTSDNKVLVFSSFGLSSEIGRAHV
jgi:general secretion pathway protein D